MALSPSRLSHVSSFSRKMLMIAIAMSGVCSIEAVEWRFQFGATNVRPGFTHVSYDTSYEAARGFGFMQKTNKIADTPSVFAVDVPEGNYNVTIEFGDRGRATSNTVKVESRRLVIERSETESGQYKTRSFTVNVRKPAISTGGTIRLNSRELGPPPTPNWDDHLTLEFNGAEPGVAAVEIKPAQDAITVFLAGDSTVTDQPNEPWAGWGQMLPRFFKQGVAISNHAESGLSLPSFERQKRLEKVLSMMKKGDYLFIQFGHNDQKSKLPGAGPFTTYRANLKRYIDLVRGKGGNPVLVTSMERRRWQDNKPMPTLADYAESVRQVGADEKVPVIDLNAMSLKFYSALGPEKSKKAFVYYPANTFPAQRKPLEDDSHHSTYGAYELARCLVEGIKTQIPDLAGRLVKDLPSFDPSDPDQPEKFSIPASPFARATAKPAGS